MKNWEIGKVPPNVKDAKAIIELLVEKPTLKIDFTSSYEYNKMDVFVNVNISVKNIGSKKAENAKIYVALKSSDKNKVWDFIESENLQIEPEEEYQYYVSNLNSPTGHQVRVYIRAFARILQISIPENKDFYVFKVSNY